MNVNDPREGKRRKLLLEEEMKAYGIIEFLVNVLRESTWHISHRFRRAASIVHESEVTTRTRDTGREGGRGEGEVG